MLAEDACGWDIRAAAAGTAAAAANDTDNVAASKLATMFFMVFFLKGWLTFPMDLKRPKETFVPS
jgi:hypothetical protein